MLEFNLEWNPLGAKMAIFVVVSWVNTAPNLFCYLFTSSTFQNFMLFFYILLTWPFVQENMWIQVICISHTQLGVCFFEISGFQVPVFTWAASMNSPLEQKISCWTINSDSSSWHSLRLSSPVKKMIFLTIKNVSANSLATISQIQIL